MSRKPGGKPEDGKNKKQQAASLARRMAGKKGQTTQLQVEVNTEEDWEKLIAREGVIVIDVYSDWSGPCVGMVGNLKKAKVDYGSESLHLAIAKNDDIEVLARFRNRSEPTWLVAAGGLLVNGMFGANAPKLLKMIDSEVKRELRVLKGETWRQGGPFTELCDEEKERERIAEKNRTEADRLEAERKAREIYMKRMKQYNHMAEHLMYETVIICFPHTMAPEGCVVLTELEMFLRAHTMYIFHQAKVVITPEMFEEIFFLGGLEANEDLLADLSLGPCLVLLLKSQIIPPSGGEGEKLLGDIERMVCESLNMCTLEPDQEFVIPDPESLPAKYPFIRKMKLPVEEPEEEGEEEEVEITQIETNIPGCWTPASYPTKCAAVRYLFPGRAEKVMLTETVVNAKVVIAFDVSKQKECFDLMEEYPEDVLNYGYFTGTNPATAEHLCQTPEQYGKLIHEDTNRLVFVVKKVKSEPLLSYAGIGATYVSADEKVGITEADLFFPPDVIPKFPRLEEAERLLQYAQTVEQEQEEEPEEEEAEEEEDADNEDDLMALLGLGPE